MDDNTRYMTAAHAMQSGVAVVMSFEESETQPKHLRVGVNSAMVEHAALVRLLISKGILTESEYAKEIADEMEREAARYEDRIRDHFSITSQTKTIKLV